MGYITITTVSTATTTTTKNNNNERNRKKTKWREMQQNFAQGLEVLLRLIARQNMQWQQLGNCTTNFPNTLQNPCVFVQLATWHGRIVQILKKRPPGLPTAPATQIKEQLSFYYCHRCNTAVHPVSENLVGMLHAFQKKSVKYFLHKATFRALPSGMRETALCTKVLPDKDSRGRERAGVVPPVNHGRSVALQRRSSGV